MILANLLPIADMPIGQNERYGRRKAQGNSLNKKFWLVMTFQEKTYSINLSNSTKSKNSIENHSCFNPTKSLKSKSNFLMSGWKKKFIVASVQLLGLFYLKDIEEEEDSDVALVAGDSWFWFHDFDF